MKMVEALIIVRKAKGITIITAIIAVDLLTKISNITIIHQQAMRPEEPTAIAAALAAITAVDLLTAAVAVVDTEALIAIKKH